MGYDQASISNNVFPEARIIRLLVVFLENFPLVLKVGESLVCSADGASVFPSHHSVQKSEHFGL